MLTADTGGNLVQSHGGRHVLQALGTFGGGTLGLMAQLPDGSFVLFGQQNGVASSFTTSGSCVLYLLPGAYKVALTGSLGASVGYAFGEANGP
jgi:hypothetical protein